MSDGVVVVGAGQAGFQVAASLRTEGYDGRITLLGDEPGLPYQRPPLSKGYMAGKQNIESTVLRPLAFYETQRIELAMGERAVAIDRLDRSVGFTSGKRISYDTLVLAVGARNRVPPLRGTQLDSLCYLRTGAEAVQMRQRLESARDVVVIGGGFIGLELAAAAAGHGKSVTVLEVQPRLMQRVLPPLLSEYYRGVHTRHGVRILLGVAVSDIKDKQVVLIDGSVYPADLVMVGVGVVPNSELANDTGLAVANGIVVDRWLRTEDENIFAIGDCSDHPNRYAGGRARLESVQNAVDQAKCVAAAIVGRSECYQSVPWFWTDQFDVKLQMAGISGGADRIVTRGEMESHRFSVFYFRGGRLIAVDSINRPGDHLAARKLLANGASLTTDQAADLSVDLKAIATAGGSL